MKKRLEFESKIETNLNLISSNFLAIALKYIFFNLTIFKENIKALVLPSQCT